MRDMGRENNRNRAAKSYYIYMVAAAVVIGKANITCNSTHTKTPSFFFEHKKYLS
jgi:hypothetical protein